MPFLQDVASKVKTMLNPMKFEGLVAEGLREIEHPIREVLSGRTFKKPFMSAAGDLGMASLQGLVGGALIYPALKYDIHGHDKMGPHEQAGDRLGTLMSGATLMAPSLFQGPGFWSGLGSGMLAGMIASPIASWAGRTAGRGVDSLLDLKVTPSELNERFSQRIVPMVQDLREKHPDVPDDQLTNYAAYQFLQQHPGYFPEE